VLQAAALVAGAGGLSGLLFNDASPAEAAAPVRAWPAFSVKNVGGKSANGLYDDQSIQRCVNAASLGSGGTIVIDVPVILGIGSVAVVMPGKGAYAIVGSAAASSIYAVNDGYPPGTPVPGIQVTAAIGGQPNGIARGLQCIFDCSAASKFTTGEFTIAFDSLMVYKLNGPVTCLAYTTGECLTFGCTRCAFQNAAICFLGPSGAAQTYRLTVKDCNGAGAFGIWFPYGGPFGGEISGNVWSEAPDGQLPSGCLGSFIHAATFPSYLVHDNFLFGQSSDGTLNRAWIYMAGIGQTSDGFIHHNVFYGASARCIYYKNDYPHAIPDPTGGLHIDHNQFVAWNLSNVGGGSAVMIDASAATTPDQLIIIGPNTFQGGYFNLGVNHSARGIEIVQNPDSANVIFDREQVMRDVTAAPYRINGVDYGAAGTTFRFNGPLVAPAYVSGTALTNPFGFDCIVDVTGTSAVAIDGTSQGSQTGQFVLPRGASITPTGASGSWSWRIA
jgi:hypothetical protein